MAKSKKAKATKKAKVIKKVVKPKVKKAVAEPKEDLKAIAVRRDKLIAEIQPKLLSKEAMKRGGPAIRTRYAQEQGYIPCFEEINALGAKLGLSPIGLGHLRK